MHVKTVIFSEKSLTFARRYCNFSERYMMTSPLHFYLSLNAFSPTFWISCQPLWSPSQCFFGAQMTVLCSTFKDNCLIGVFSYAVGSRGPEKGSDNSVIMRLQQIFTFVAKLWRMSWQPHALSTSTFLIWTLRCSEKKIAGHLSVQMHKYFCEDSRVYLSIWMRRLRMSESCWAAGKYGEILRLCFYSLCTATVSSLKGGRTQSHSTSSSS